MAVNVMVKRIPYGKSVLKLLLSPIPAWEACLLYETSDFSTIIKGE